MIKGILITLVSLPPFFGVAQPKNWQNLDLQRDSVFGISTEKAYSELLKGKTPQPVIVAVIDAGVDTNHEDLKVVLWHNPKHKAFDDGTFGWSFIGSAKRQVRIDNNVATVVVREFERGDTTKLSSRDLETYHKAKEKLQKALAGGSEKNSLEKSIDSLFATRTREIHEYEQRDTTRLSDSSLVNYRAKKDDLQQLTEALGWKQLRDGESIDSVCIKLARRTQPTPGSMGSFQVYIICIEYLAELVSQYCSFNTAYDPHSLDKQRHYGFPDVMGPDALHGTHVAGIIGAVRNNGIGINGIADNVRIMAIRAVPVRGDERDKDVANAIRYAAKHGAKVINMSFGKEYATDKKAVDKAVKYAMKKDVLLVQAAGNSYQDIDTVANFPDRNYQGGGHAGAYIVVGASAWRNDKDLGTEFSNYGKTAVDVFAPGVDITSTVPGNKYEALGGTSMAAPVVAGLAALIREYYPKLKAQQVKDIILQSVVKSDYLIGKCLTGGVVNAYNALQLAAKKEDVN